MQPNEGHLRQIRAISLVSGGLDSLLAIRVVQSQGIEIHGLALRSLFFEPGSAEKTCKMLNVPVHIEDFTSTLLSLIQHPKHGFGAGMNPCIDCHIAMLKQAGQFMEEGGFDFIITGDVLNQRPMSQNRHALDMIAAESGFKELILRPLSAKLLGQTKPEQAGWVKREQLLDLHGRTRKPQLSLAKQFGLTGYLQPAGGCILTDTQYSERLKDLKEHEGIGNHEHIKRLRLGRHFRLENEKLVVGRNEDENMHLEKTALATDLILKPASVPGPTGLIPYTATETELLKAAAICARYSDCQNNTMTEIEILSCHGKQTVCVIPADHESIEPLRI